MLESAMNLKTLDLLFLEPGEDDLPGPPRVHIAVNSYSHGSYKGHENIPLIGSECVSMHELDYQIESLKRELDQLKVKAARKFKEADKRMSDRLERRIADRSKP